MCFLNFVLFFRLNYKCNYGESIYVVGNIEALGNWNPSRALKLTWTEGHNWVQALKLIHDNNTIIEYKYIVAPSDGYAPFTYIRWESGPNRCLDLFTTSKLKVKLHDEWEHNKIRLALHHDTIQSYVEGDKRVILCTSLDHGKSVQEMKLKKFMLDNGMKEESFWTASFRIPNYVTSFYYKYKIVGKTTEDVLSDRKSRKFSMKKFPLNTYSKKIYMLNCTTMTKFDLSFDTTLNLNMITDDIIVGAFPQNSKDVEELTSMGVRGVLNLQTFGDMERFGTDWKFLQECYQKADITAEHLPIIDMDLKELKLNIEKATDILHRLLKQGKVYVHCTAGRYRSPHVIISYLCSYRNFEVVKAVDLVKSKRVKIRVFEEMFSDELEKNIKRV